MVQLNRPHADMDISVSTESCCESVCLLVKKIEDMQNEMLKIRLS